MTRCPAASIQSSCLELAVGQAPAALGCLFFPVAGVRLAVTLGQVQVGVLLLRRVLANLFPLLEGTGDLAVKRKTLFLQGSKGSISLCSAIVSVVLSESQKLS